jgi:hypothetical protein
MTLPWDGVLLLLLFGDGVDVHLQCTRAVLLLREIRALS